MFVFTYNDARGFVCGALGHRAALFKGFGDLHGMKLMVVKVSPEGNWFFPIKNINAVDSDGAVVLWSDEGIGMNSSLLHNYQITSIVKYSLLTNSNSPK